MASQAEATRLTEAHRQMQVAIAARTTRAMVMLWERLLDPFNLDATAPRWLNAVTPVIATQAVESARMSAAYYQAFRGAEIGEPLAVSSAIELPAEQIRTSLTLTGPAAVKRAQKVNVTERAMQIGLSMSSGAAERLALAGGRQVLMNAVKTDRRCIGYARVTSGRACSFCAMLAGRGAVYSEESVHFRAHGNCHCTAEPLYEDYELPAQNQRYADLWAESTAGLSGKEALAAFRQAINA